jgi:DtxR family Mn-dependent transcriptional regulator
VPSLTIENYLKAIYQLAGEHQKPAATGQIAQTLGVSPGSVTSMLKTLSEAGMVTYTPYEGVQVTEAGRRIALRVVRRHRLIELFLVKTLGMNWDEVHEEAEHMEHSVSDLLIDRIDGFLDYPDTDPHGDPIPRADGSLPTSNSLPLVECQGGDRFRLVRVLDQSSDFLQYLSEIGLRLGDQAVLVRHNKAGGILFLHTCGDSHASLGRDAAEKLLVEKIP